MAPHHRYERELRRALEITAHSAFAYDLHEHTYDEHFGTFFFNAILIAYVRCAADKSWSGIVGSEIGQACLDLFNFFSTGADIFYPGYAKAKIDRHCRALKMNLYFTEDYTEEECQEVEKMLRSCNVLIQSTYAAYAERIEGKVATAYELVKQPNFNEESGLVCERKEEFKHGMRAMIYIRDKEPHYNRYACLRTVANRMVELGADMPEDFPLKCLGEQFGLAGKNEEALSDVYFAQNVLARFVVKYFASFQACQWAKLKEFKKAATRRAQGFDELDHGHNPFDYRFPPDFKPVAPHPFYMLPRTL